MINFGTVSLQNQEKSLLVRIWTDDSFCLVEDYISGEYEWKSDDYIDVDLYDHEAVNNIEPKLQKAILEEYMGPMSEEQAIDYIRNN